MEIWYWTLLVTAAWALGEAKGPTYLPPAEPEPTTISAEAESGNASVTTMQSNAEQEALNDTDGLLNRLGEPQSDSGSIHFAQSQDDQSPQMAWESQVAQTVSRGVARLALQLDRVLSKRETRSSEPPPTVVFSPISIAAALALVMLGSGGKTLEEVSQVLGLADSVGTGEGRGNAVHQHFGRLLIGLERRAASTSASEALSAQGVFVQKGLALRARFQQVARQAYRSEVMTLDFANRPGEAQTAVNEWVANKTRGRIVDILAEPPPPTARLIIATALYFNGHWEFPFPKEGTLKRKFYVTGDADGEVLTIDMMANNADLPYHEDAELGCKMLGLPYKGRDVVMYLVLPTTPGAASLKDLENRLTVETLEDLISRLTEKNVIVVMPRTKLEYSSSLVPALKQLGVNTLFDPFSANLTQLLADNTDSQHSQRANNVKSGSRMIFRERRQAMPPLYVDEVLHKVEVEITETGTIASAATILSVTRDGSHKSFRADRPFLFFIRHEPTGLILFWGSVIRPTPAPLSP